MVKLVNAVMLERQGWLLGLLLAALSFAALLGIAEAVADWQIGSAVEESGRAAIERRLKLDADVDRSLESLRALLDGEPCSAGYRAALRRFAYRPDGLNEFFYAPGGAIGCSVTTERFDPPVMLGFPDVGTETGASAVWLDRDLASIGLDGLTGSIVRRGALAVVVPAELAATAAVPTPNWIRLEVVRRDARGDWRHRTGEFGLHRAVAGAGRTIADPRQRATVCDATGSYCAAAVAEPLRLMASRKGTVLAGLASLAAVALLLAGVIQQRVKRYCSFENRFRRHLSAESIVCSYQPVMDLGTSRIAGCEVLARWRDVDGSTVFPDRFIPLVEREELTLAFTRAIVEKAMRELSAALPDDARLHVAFNVFPVDLADRRLPEVFRCCRSERHRFSIIAEIVESAAFVAAEARAQIEALRREGVGVYLDDFGAGYSNIQNLASLPIEGVKLDRAFAMAPEDSLMSRMLTHAIDLVGVSGRVMVVEGVETAGRLESLRALGTRVGRAQGYHISRPLPIAEFAAFLATEERRRDDIAAAAGSAARFGIRVGVKPKAAVARRGRSRRPA